MSSGSPPSATAAPSRPIAGASTINATATTIPVANAAAIAVIPGDYYILIDGEQMLVTSVNTTATPNTLTVQRGVNGTARTSLNVGDGVYLATDQRGNGRDSTPDIGAFQLTSGPATA